ncbi:hypothetical protein [Cohnella boryungensis]|uniref:DUF1648 domain-containing protein n=1 Tax=Cohnella boryungensis TaxID=768479 RepID=A0ABV8SCI8_9BACL
MSKQRMIDDERVIFARNEGAMITLQCLVAVMFIDLILQALIPEKLKLHVWPEVFPEGFPIDIGFMFSFIAIMGFYHKWRREQTIGTARFVFALFIALFLFVVIFGVVAIWRQNQGLPVWP